MTSDGLKILLGGTGFELKRLLTGIDGISLIMSSILNRSVLNILKRFTDRIIWKSKDTPINRLINLYWGGYSIVLMGSMSYGLQIVATYNLITSQQQMQ